MKEKDSDAAARAASHLTQEQVDLLLCICRVAIYPMSKRELRKRVLMDGRYDVDCSPSTFWDRHRKLVDLGFLAKDPSDPQIISVTHRGASARDWLIEQQQLRALRESSNDSIGARPPQPAIKAPN